MNIKYYIGAIMMCTATVSYAGSPIQEIKKCPVGGEEFSITNTGSCSSFGGSQDFLLRSATSCDFVTKLAQCPTNKLPLYKEFTPDEVIKLEDYVNSDDFRALGDRSRYFLAHKVSEYLAGNDEPQAENFYLMWGGLQYDRLKTLNDTEFMDAFYVVAEAKLKTPQENKEFAYIRALLAFTQYYQGNFEKARSFVDAVKIDPTYKENEFLNSYIRKLEDCISSADSKRCASTDRVVDRK